MDQAGFGAENGMRGYLFVEYLRKYMIGGVGWGRYFWPQVRVMNALVQFDLRKSNNAACRYAAGVHVFRRWESCYLPNASQNIERDLSACT